MSLDQFLIDLVLVLVGLLLGGAGGQAIIKRAVGSGGADNSSAIIAANAASAAALAAANTAAASNLVLTNHIASLQNTLDDHGKTLVNIEKEQTRLAQALEGYCEVCRTKHEAIDQRESQIQKEIDGLRSAG